MHDSGTSRGKRFRNLIPGGTYQQSRWVMNAKTLCNSLFKSLEGRELTGITFIHDYIQFHFDEPILNAYTFPQVTTANATLNPDTPGYRDALCGQIGKTVVVAHEELNQQLSLHFCDKTVISISLQDEDRVCAESAMLQADSGKRWNVW